MKIISNGELYVKRSDINFLAHFDSSFPVEIAMKHLMDDTKEKYIRITNMEQIEYFLSQEDVLDFSDLMSKTKEEIMKMILKLKIEMCESDYSREEGMTKEEYRKSQIESYKNRLRIEYLISQLKESLEYRKGKNRNLYPNIPNPLYKGITDGQITAGISVRNGNIVFYKENHEEISTDEIDPGFYKTAVATVQNDLSVSEEESTYEETISEDNKYIILESKSLEEVKNKPKTRKLLKNSKSNQ